MSDNKRRTLLSAGATLLLVLVLLSVLAVPRVYAGLATPPRWETDESEPEQIQPPLRGSYTQLSGELDFPIPLNTATAEMLAAVPQIGHGTAPQVIFWRGLLGGFERVEDLARLLKLDEEAADRLADYLEADTPPAPSFLDSVDAQAEADRVIALLAAQLERTDLDSAAELGEMLALLEQGRDRLARLLGEEALAKYSDIDQLMELLELRRDWLLGA